ncbi:MAG TPA: flippase [Candidatus Omnitrophota bacterium]|nr:flippase [Candidatus Omnitrophota bacterium]
MRKVFLRKLDRIIPRKERRVVWENFLSLSSLQALNYLLPVIFLPYVIRIIGPEKFGLIAFAQALMQYFIILTDYGFSLSATREIALVKEQPDKVKEIFSAVLATKIVLAIASFIILIVMLRFIPRFKYDSQVFIYSFGAVIGSTLFPLWYFQGMERMKYIAGLNICGGIIFAAGVFIAVRGPSDYLLIPMLYSMVSVATGIAGLYVVFRKFSITYSFQRYADIKQQLKAGWNIFCSSVAINAYTSTRIVAVGLLTTNTVTGYYSIAEKVASIIQLFPLASFAQALFPRLTKIYLHNRKKAFRMMKKIQAFTTTCFLVILPVAYWISPLIIIAVAGRPYAEAVITLRLLIVSVFFVGANAFRIQFLMVCGRTASYAMIHVIMAAIGMPLIFVMIRYFSYWGAALATIAIEAGIFLLTSARIRNITFHPRRPAQWRLAGR